MKYTPIWYDSIRLSSSKNFWGLFKVLDVKPLVPLLTRSMPIVEPIM